MAESVGNTKHTTVKLTLGRTSGQNKTQFIEFPSEGTADIFAKLANGAEHRSGKTYTAEVLRDATVRSSEGVSAELMNLELSDVSNSKVLKQLGLISRSL